MKPNFEHIFLGIAIGDAYGAGLEFQDRNWIRTNVDFTRFINKRTDINVPEKAVFTVDYKEWDYTDDTEMSIAVAKALMSGEPVTDELLVKYFTDEYLLGFQTKGYKRNGHGSIRLVYNGEKDIEEIRDFQRNKTYPGNAPPMRAIPIGFVPEELINGYALVNATSTHPHQKAVDASILIARAARGLLVEGIGHDELISYCLKHIIDQETIEKLEAADRLHGPDLLQGKDFEALCGPQPLQKKEFIEGLYGLSSNAMYTAIAALYFIKHSRSAFEGLKHSINLGGDVDSLASIVTGILAGKYGIDSLPAYMIEQVEGVPYLKEIAKAFEVYFEKKTTTVALYRPVGQPELNLIAASGYKAFPPRLSWQPIFYPVLNEEYASSIAQEWNTNDEANGNVGYVTRFEIPQAYFNQFEVQNVGARHHNEIWVPADQLEEFNARIVGRIEVIRAFYGEHFKGEKIL